MKPPPHYHLKYKISVSGAAETGHCAPDALEKAKEIGKEIASHNAVLITGATTGFPYWAAIGAKEAGGFVIGVSPADSEKNHIEDYKLPVDYHDIIIYTGFEYSGRNLLLTRSADAVIVGCGRMGTLNEFTIAFEDNKPIGILTGAGGSTEWIDEIIKDSHRGSGKVVYDSDPKILVEKVIELIKKEKIIEV
ncbi:MAG: hypothetical protein A3H02_00390 [Candidatus Niyogibacteria bacterium RIFCSPLOWO2_12_FULL_41_13]|uniref:Protein containing YHS domain protein n=1 Tax=Candidatus Niyogibacteria bacterium RIFCSPLOWO2_12_FULL_41_13 TaxID=1801726 RepID=A0A1G2F2E4_9BACT|nr:MAG: hypothetical protein A3H02_00390 [Candidatus Niyogibacteria bacterium RIFCSPLOWO2_12_FULL_41_13]